MATRINDGGPAFPRPASEYTASGTLQDGNDAIREQDGMTLRDYFAGQIMAELARIYCDCDPTHANKCAERSYAWADAMLAARTKGDAS